MESIKGRIIRDGTADGEILFSTAPIGFFGNINPETGIVNEPGHPLQGQCVAGKILVFPHAKGSTVGSYILYALKKKQLAPAAMILKECEIIIAVGAIIGDIPTIDQVDITALRNARRCTVADGMISFE